MFACHAALPAFTPETRHPRFQPMRSGHIFAKAKRRDSPDLRATGVHLSKAFHLHSVVV